MKKFLFFVSCLAMTTVSLGQDTAKVKSPAVEITPAEPAKQPAAEAEKKFSNIKSGPGTNGKDTITDTGVAIAPSHMFFRCKPGKSETIMLTVTNDTKKAEQFKVSFQDYTMDANGKTTPTVQGSPSPYGLSKFIMVAPSVIDLKPGEKKKVAVTVSMPETDEAYRASWTLLMLDRINAKKYILPESGDEKTMQMGVTPTYGFGVHVFQNPPNVKVNKVEITKFNFTYDDSAKYVSLKVKNSGDGMGFCKSYVEISNLKTGKVEKHLLKQFVVFPGLERNLEMVVPGKIEKGNYSIMLILDFGSKEQIEAAETEITVK